MSLFTDQGQKDVLGPDSNISSLVIRDGPTMLPYLPDGVLQVTSGLVNVTTDPSELANIANIIYQPFNGSPPHTIAGNIYNTWSDVVTFAGQLNINGTLNIWFDWKNAAGAPIAIGGISGPRISFKSNWSLPSSEGSVLPVVLFDPGLNGTPTQFLIDLFEIDGMFQLKIRGNKVLQTMMWSTDYIAGMAVRNGASILFDYNDPGVVPISFAGSIFNLTIFNCQQSIYGALTAQYGGVSKVDNSQVQPFLMAPNQTFAVNISGGGIGGNDPTVGPNYGLATCSVPGAGGNNRLFTTFDSSSFMFQDNPLTAGDATFFTVGTNFTSLTDNVVQNGFENPSSFLPPPLAPTPVSLRNVIDWLTTPIGVSIFNANIVGPFAIGNGNIVDVGGNWQLDYQAGFTSQLLFGTIPQITVPGAFRPCRVKFSYSVPFTPNFLVSEAKAGDNVSVYVQVNGSASYAPSTFVFGKNGQAFDTGAPPNLNPCICTASLTFDFGAGGDIVCVLSYQNNMWQDSNAVSFGSTTFTNIEYMHFSITLEK